MFSSNGRDGNITVIQEQDPNTYQVIDTVPTAVSARTMDVDPETGRIYLAAATVDPATLSQPRPKILPGSLKLLFLDLVR